ncbi:MAB_1171c family putative transporter [Kitasatospora sp. NPDC057015]|uniref:MAB_1171c family putative transporter n=1 Tax=Kitasatospora sp. NPDC057015 TaxID=3346001 RepID=UPI003644F459
MPIINLTVCIALWAITVWRAPGAWRHKEKRSLWAAFFVLAVEMCFSNDPATRWIDHTTGINSVAALLKHISAVTAAAFVLAFLADTVATSAAAPSGKAPRPTRVFVPVATIAVMITLFVIADRPHEAVDLLLASPNDPWILAYALVWTTYFGWAMVTVSRLSWQWSRRPGPASLRRGLTLICAGTSIGLVYTIHRASMIFLGRFDVQAVSPETDTVLNGLLALVSLLLISVGSTMPAYPKARTALRYHRYLVKLYPLWDHLSEAAPHIRYGHKPHPFREFLSVRGSRDRLYRRSIEIRDAILILNGDAPVSVRLRAADFVEDAGLTGPAAVTATEACWIRAARGAHSAGLTTAGSPEPPAQSGADLDSEAALLLQLSDAYFSDLATSFAQAHLERLTNSVSGATS